MLENKGGLWMPVFAVIMKHTPESCPMFNDEVKNKFKELVARKEEAQKKHGIREISAYTSILSHQIFSIVEAPSQQAVENSLTESGFAFWNNVEVLTQVQPVADVIKKVVGQ